MKKTLTVNLGGTVFSIDDDAYRLLDNYICNLKAHFSREVGADEIVDDMERRISELFSEKTASGQQVITIADVEQVIARMGKPEEMEEGSPEEQTSQTDEEEHTSQTDNSRQSATDGKAAVSKRLFRNPDDKMLGGVIGGLAAYMGWDVTLLRLLALVVFIAGYGVLVPVYLVCWIVIPEARTAAEKLSMRGEPVTVENIGRTVTDGFEHVSAGVNNFVKSGKPRTALQKVGDVVVQVAVGLMKLILIVLAVVCSPVLFLMGFVFVVLLFAAIVTLFSGGAAMLSVFPALAEAFPMAGLAIETSPLAALVMSLSGILIVGIPLACLVVALLGSWLKWRPMATGLKWTLLVLWVVCIVCYFLSFRYGQVAIPEWFDFVHI